MAKNKIKKEQEKITFDPTKQYQWQHEDIITFTGKEFEVLSKSLTMLVTGSATDMQTLLNLALTANMVQSKLVEYVENGIFKEYIPQEQNTK